jgi:tartrate dehydratase alpha subunit/fumarate hydratase class I-like protein
MRTIYPRNITDAVAKAVIDANYYLPHDVVKSVKEAAAVETSKQSL